MIAIFYFLVFRPMQRQQKNQKEMVRSLQNGQTVVTSGGIVGTIVAVNDDTLILRIKPDNLKLQVVADARLRAFSRQTMRERNSVESLAA